MESLDFDIDLELDSKEIKLCTLRLTHVSRIKPGVDCYKKTEVIIKSFNFICSFQSKIDLQIRDIISVYTKPRI
ncbi:hypothetical protein RRG08_053434 [Elysia crispata]|uniref:Uncharacterized protein n=1 Tax=Elysia crispata TaxID=231223 RepID=A0AAE0ZFM8_9GAST|nr:hypothetical protein RRG08_053434 [Elysia crispata]